MVSLRSWRRVFVSGAVLVGGACGGPQPLGGVGDACVRAADCAPGLVCIEAQCSDDLTGLGADSAGPDPGQGAAGDANGAAGAPSPSGGSTASGGASSTGGAASGGTSLGGSAGGN